MTQVLRETDIYGPSDEAVVMEKSPSTERFMPEFVRMLESRSDAEKNRDLIETVKKYCLDRGVNEARELILSDESGMHRETAEGCEILQRTSLINYIEERYPSPEEARGKVFIQLIDIADFRSADKVESPNGEKGADYLINRIASNVLENVSAVNESLRQQYDNECLVVPCRYGGDELGILFDNIPDPVIRNRIMEKIAGDKEGITSLEGYFMRGGLVVKEPVRLKAGLKEIGIPENPQESGIFWEYMHRGVLLDADEIQRVQENEPGVTNLSLEKPETLEHILERHPEFTKMAALTAALEPDGSPEQKILLDELEKYIKTNLYDRLLGEAVAGMRDFVEHHIREPFNRVQVIDVKGIKEINDNLGIAEGDLAIADAWRQIQGILHEPGMTEGNVEVFRRGGTLLVGESREGSLTEKGRDKLSNLNMVTILDNGRPLTFNIVSYSAEIKSPESFSDSAEIRIFLDRVFRETDLEWYKRQFLLHLEDTQVFEKIPSIGTGEKPDISTPNGFYNMFLYGTRKVERLKAAVRALDMIEADGLKDLTDKDAAEKSLQYLREIFVKELP